MPANDGAFRVGLFNNGGTVVSNDLAGGTGDDAGFLDTFGYSAISSYGTTIHRGVFVRPAGATNPASTSTGGAIQVGGAGSMEPTGLTVDVASHGEFQVRRVELTTTFGGVSESYTTSAAVGGMTFNHVHLQSTGLGGVDSMTFENLQIEASNVPSASTALKLLINTDTGATTFLNSHDSIDMNFYELKNASGSLAPGSWNSLDAQNIDAVDGDDAGSVAGDSLLEGWDKAVTNTPNAMTEAFLLDMSTVGNGGSLSLGNAYDTGVNGTDVVFSYGLIIGGEKVVGLVEYVSGTLAGNYNGDSIVDAKDYTVWRDALGRISGDLSADGNGNGTVDAADYSIWKNNYGMVATASGAGNLTTAAVPEPPSSVSLA